VIEGMSVVETIENCETGANDRPVRPVVIADCGEIVSSEDTSIAESKGDETVEEQPAAVDSSS
jgi:peptidyl-prolyl isomerase D